MAVLITHRVRILASIAPRNYNVRHDDLLTYLFEIHKVFRFNGANPLTVAGHKKSKTDGLAKAGRDHTAW